MKEIIFYLAGIVLANITVHILGIVTILGITFPAGAVFVGLTFSFRDMLQAKHGKWGCWKWMGVALLLTLAFNPGLAVASGVAFIISEAIDWAIFTFSNRPFNQRIILSNLFGTPVDSLVFVCLAFGWNWPAIWGQTLVKMVSSLFVLWMKPKARVRA